MFENVRQIKKKESKMDYDRKRTRDKIKNIPTIKDFDDLLSQTMLNDDDIKIMEMIYKDRLPLGVIADRLCMSESTIKRKHKRILVKMSKMF
jgi:DNA-directed RNA polymerase specialized sigma subunit